MSQGKEKLGFARAAFRAVSVLACAVGAAACAYSLVLQFRETADIRASVCWFSGLFSLVGGIAGYATTSLGRKGPRHTWVAFAVGIALAALAFLVEERCCSIETVIAVAVVSFVVQGVLLVVCHFVLKREDPYAL